MVGVRHMTCATTGACFIPPPSSRPRVVEVEVEHQSEGMMFNGE